MYTDEQLTEGMKFEEQLLWLTAEIDRSSKYASLDEDETASWYDVMEQWFWSGISNSPNQLDLDGLTYTVEMIESEGGEGQGDSASMLFSATDETGHARYFIKHGYYASFHGFDWDGSIAEVFPRQKTITVYE